MSYELHNFRVSPWIDTVRHTSDARAALFNGDSLARANLVQGQDAYAVDIDGVRYLAYKRNASLVIGSLALVDQLRLLRDEAQLRPALAAVGVKVLAMNTFNADDDLPSLRDALRDGCNLRYEFCLDIAAYKLSGISTNHKRNIRKSIKAGVEVAPCTSGEGVNDHLRIVNQNLEGKGVGSLSGSPAYYQSLLDSGAGLLLQARSGSELLGSTFFICNDGYAYYHSSGTSRAGRDKGVAHHIVHEAITELSTRSVGCLNLGGATADQYGLLRFKMGFRPRVNLLASGRRRLASGARDRLRAIIPSTPGDIVRIQTTGIFSRPAGAAASRDNEVGLEAKGEARVQALHFDDLAELVRATPGAGRALQELCASGDACYACYAGEKLLAVLLLRPVQARGARGGRGAMEITHLEVLDDRAGQEEWQRCLGLLAAACGDAGEIELQLRAAPDEQQKQDFARRAGFRALGGERKWTSPLVNGVVNGLC